MDKKKTYIFLLVLIAIAGLAWAMLDFYFGRPLLGKLSHDFGTVPIEQPYTIVEHVFTLKNNTDHALRLKSATPSCGCTTTEWPESSVSVGDALVIPVHLKLRKSQLRKSRIRLEFDTGEMVILRIEGVGRFTQQMRISPPQLPLSMGPLGGAKGVIRLEWDGEERPENPIFQFPEGIEGEFDAWRFATSADSHKGIPEIWTIRLRLALEEASMKTNQVFTVTMPNMPVLEVPILLEETKATGRIGFD